MRRMKQGGKEPGGNRLRYDEAREGSRCKRASVASHCESSSSSPFLPALHSFSSLFFPYYWLLQEHFISRCDTTERQVTTSNCRISGCHLSSSNGFRSSRRSNATAAEGKRGDGWEGWLLSARAKIALPSLSLSLSLSSSLGPRPSSLSSYPLLSVNVSERRSRRGHRVGRLGSTKICHDASLHDDIWLW